jgi:hypothetical protein
VLCGVARARARWLVPHFEARHPRQVALKLKQADKALLEEHYGDLKSKPFFPGLVEYMLSGPVVPMVSCHPRRERASERRACQPRARARCCPLCARKTSPSAPVGSAPPMPSAGQRRDMKSGAGGLAPGALIIHGMVLP